MLLTCTASELDIWRYSDISIGFWLSEVESRTSTPVIYELSVRSERTLPAFLHPAMTTFPVPAH